MEQGVYIQRRKDHDTTRHDAAALFYKIQINNSIPAAVQAILTKTRNHFKHRNIPLQEAFAAAASYCRVKGSSQKGLPITSIM